MKKINKITLILSLLLMVAIAKSAMWTHKNPKIWKEIAENKIEFTTQRDIENIKNRIE
ncbi:hypothetical protein [Clostridium perfringens]|uniref:hypothetical protein n=1 Tax=Clostridium perfringens TaxID=1502 RepID=UPI002ED01776|nr:hypothetical protein LMS42_014815 [Clostridium perfringens]